MAESLIDFNFSEENKLIAVNILKKYPVDRKNSAVMPLLDIAQRQNDGWLSRDTIEYVAEYLGMPIIKVMEVVTFYTMYHTEPTGKYIILFCHNISCQLNGADNLFAYTGQKLGVSGGGTTEDKKFTLNVGDSFRLRGEPYRWANPYEQAAVVIWVIAPPVY